LYPSQMQFFPSPLISILLFFHNFKERLKVTALAWCPDNGNVTHKHLVEMRGLARDETPFIPSMQLRDITLVWLPYDINFIPLDIHGCDRSAHDETSYPSTNLSSIYLLYCGSPLFNDKCFISFLGDPWVKHLEGSYMDFIFYPTPTPLGI